MFNKNKEQNNANTDNKPTDLDYVIFSFTPALIGSLGATLLVKLQCGPIKITSLSAIAFASTALGATAGAITEYLSEDNGASCITSSLTSMFLAFMAPSLPQLMPYAESSSYSTILGEQADPYIDITSIYGKM